jgi:hypothetical protein
MLLELMQVAGGGGLSLLYAHLVLRHQTPRHLLPAGSK